MESGKYIDGRYKIKHILGSGGMANVFLATDLILERDVAIKVMRYDFKDDQNSIRRFHREAAASTELLHPNIVSVYDVGGEEYPYIVMEYVEGPNLMEYIDKNHPISYRKIIAIMQEILSGVDYAHSKGVIHRDLKPQNILMNNSGQAMITDFGIAVALTQQSITQTNSVLGSVQYIAPEQAKGSIASAESDIYSLGIILYQMLSNELPFDGESAVSIALKHFQEPMPSLRELDPNVPQALENVVLKATAKDPKQRYQSAKEMSEDLKTSLSPERYGEEKFVEITENLNHIDTIPITSVKNISATKEFGQTGEAVIASDTTSIPIDSVSVKDDEAEATPTKKNEKPKKRYGLAAIIVLLLAIVIAGAYYISLPKDVEIPTIEGMMLDEIDAYLDEYNLEVGDVIDEASQEYEEDTIIRTNPGEGEIVKEGSEIDLYVSTGQPFIEFPNVVGEDFEEIRAQLTEQGFTVEREDVESTEYEVGVITNQDIDEGEEVRPSETTVTLTVSTGLPTISVRDLSGYSWQSVQDYADEMGLSVSRTEEYHDEVNEGQVISQSPAAGSSVTVGDSLSVVISSGPEEENQVTDRVTIDVTIPYVNTTADETSASQSSDDSSSSSGTESEATSAEIVPNDVVIYVEDATRTYDQPYRTMRITNDTTVQLVFNLEEGQTGRYRIERNGEIIEESQIAN